VIGPQAFVPTPEDVVVMALRFALPLNSPKDAEDARGVVAVQGERLDWNYIRRWCDAHGTWELCWTKCGHRNHHSTATTLNCQVRYRSGQTSATFPG
jgi:hypothetical protein